MCSSVNFLNKYVTPILASEGVKNCDVHRDLVCQHVTIVLAK
jgi:hypothetical protein